MYDALVKEMKLVCPMWNSTRDRQIHPGKKRYDDLIDIYNNLGEPKAEDDEEQKVPQKASTPIKSPVKSKAGRPPKTPGFKVRI